MTRKVCLMLTFACLAAGGVMGGCEVDDSAPTRPRTRNIWALDPKAQDNAEMRATEAPPKTRLPDTGNEVTGKQPSMIDHSPATGQVVTLQASPGGGAGGGAAGAGMGATGVGSAGYGNLQVQKQGFEGPSGWQAFGHTTGPTTVYNNDYYHGALPHLPANPGSVPMAGSTPAPDGDWNIDHSWGQGLVLLNYPHRPWPDEQATYQGGAVKHNPTYYFNIQEHINVPQATWSTSSDWISELYEVPWFYVNTLALPVLMALEPPLAQRTTERPSGDPNYRGHIPAEGEVVPVPMPGALEFHYDFLNPDGTVKEPGTSAAETAPGTETAPATTQTGR